MEMCSPLMARLGHDYYGAYNPVLRRLAVLPAALSVLFFCFLKRPVHPLDRGKSAEGASIYARP